VNALAFIHAASIDLQPLHQLRQAELFFTPNKTGNKQLINTYQSVD